LILLVASLEALLQEQIYPAAAPVVLPDVEYPEMQLPCEMPITQNTQLPTPPTLGDGSLGFYPRDLNMDTDMSMLQSLDYNTDPEISELVRADL